MSKESSKSSRPTADAVFSRTYDMMMLEEPRELLSICRQHGHRFAPANALLFHGITYDGKGVPHLSAWVTITDIDTGDMYCVYVAGDKVNILPRGIFYFNGKIENYTAYNRTSARQNFDAFKTKGPWNANLEATFEEMMKERRGKPSEEKQPADGEKEPEKNAGA